MSKHRWGDKTVISLHKAERCCLNGCGIVKVSRYEFDGGRDKFWTEFYRGLDRIECSGRPPCSGRPARVSYSAESYPL